VIFVLKRYKAYIISIVIALAIGGLSSWLTRGNMNIYDEISIPPLSPPMWLFPIVWGILYILMGISSAAIYKSVDPKKGSALRIYALQLIVNFFWPLIFFNMRAFGFSVIWLALLIALVITMIVLFAKINLKTAYLQIPYILWLMFAMYLTVGVYILN
jgi:tryptophan-rich sensory protein